jgi:hypothetical protein
VSLFGVDVFSSPPRRRVRRGFYRFLSALCASAVKERSVIRINTIGGDCRKLQSVYRDIGKSNKKLYTIITTAAGDVKPVDSRG